MASASAMLAGILACEILSADGPSFAPAANAQATTSSAGEKGLLEDRNFFPLAVWMQDQRNAAKFGGVFGTMT
ncbi:MAG: hypothetical protein HZA50_12655 [Planctomycetes bacterium]|nr:hypothetical protein [Planctomycetota bacterium]